MTGPDTAREVAGKLTKAQREALLRAGKDKLLQSQSDRGTLTGLLTDYSFRPARLTPLGQQVRALLQESSHG